MPPAMVTPCLALRLVLSGLVLAPLTLTGCGSSQAGSTAPANADLTVVAQDIKFDKKSYTVAKSGPLTISYDNKGQQTHSMLFEDGSGHKVDDFRLQVAPGQDKGATITLPAGTYTMYCDIPGHRAAGMVATVTVG